ncbi:hypothetical protein SISSUDRAFT_420692 [Sistotremastrum suecicum HHB10207 ss-3]|uniref:F-box domain-containing protein n=1 Tax=Sistotremastrum suecicum HHB10207 ss-3 TaxID=1314776 RepID=A0A165YL73_9AGAM|nr:hypothetical protein SISSUDRAFT_420692 [Sistotremastrum suecicum HHB10207 ss-3]
MDYIVKYLSSEALFTELESKLTDEFEQLALTCHTCPEKISAIDVAEHSLTNFAATLTRMEKRIQEMFLSMKQKRNMYAPIGKLCDELISKILEDYVYEQHSWMIENDLKGYQLWIPSAFSVCTKWRSVAINTPALWTKIPPLPSKRKVFELFRDRSRSMPLDVVLQIHDDGNQSKSPDVAHGDALREIASRISSLKVSSPEEVMAEFFQTHVGRAEFSSLAILDVSTVFWEEESSFSFNAPAIHTLIWRGLLPPHSLMHPHRLVNLSYTSYSLRSSRILDILSEMPSLEQLSVWSCEENRPIPTVARAKVSLQRLKRLCVRNMYLHEMVHLLHHLIIPPSADIELVLMEMCDEMSMEEFSHLAGPYMPTCHSLEIAKAKPDRCESFESANDIEELFANRHGRGICLTLLSHVRGRIRLQWFRFLSHGYYAQVEGFNTSKLLELLASYPNILTRIDWTHQSGVPLTTSSLITAFSSWPLITHIRIQAHEDDFERFLTALEDTPDIICPALTILDCCGIRFSSVRMASFLEFRKDRGVPIHEIIMTRGFAEGGVDEFIHLVPTVSFIEPEVEPEAKEVDTGSEGEGDTDEDEDEDD